MINIIIFFGLIFFLYSVFKDGVVPIKKCDLHVWEYKDNKLVCSKCQHEPKYDGRE